MAEPFLTYLTVFKSRLGIANILLSVTDFRHQQVETLQRRLRQIVDNRDELQLDDPRNNVIFSYLLEKSLISATVRKSGRYQGYSLSNTSGDWSAQNARGQYVESLRVYLIDKWMSDPRLRSTVGAPTPDNVGEIVEFGYQIRLISRSKNTWTAAGHLSRALRESTQWSEVDSDNPFLLGLELPAFLRQIVDCDGFVLREILREIIRLQPQFTRDQLAGRFGDIVDRAVAAAREHRVSGAELQEIRGFAKQVHQTLSKRAKMSKGPGLLEHRVSPRLEWLTDLGYLSKDGVPKNSFEFRVQPNAIGLLESLDGAIGSDKWGSNVAITEWWRNSSWSELRSSLRTSSGEDRILNSYRMLRRQIGPVPIQDVAFAGCMGSKTECTFKETFDEIIEFARATDGVNLAGGRYRRSPENIFISDAVLDR